MQIFFAFVSRGVSKKTMPRIFSCTGADRADVVRRAMDTKRIWEEKSGRSFRVYVGELHSEVIIQCSPLQEIPIEAEEGD